MADAEDSKSSVGNHVRVQVPPSAPKILRAAATVLCHSERRLPKRRIPYPSLPRPDRERPKLVFERRVRVLC